MKNDSQADPRDGRQQEAERPAPSAEESEKRDLAQAIRSTRKQLPKPSPR